jgi:hypothetical protein
MSERELIDLCKEPSKKRVSLNWVAEVYGFGTMLRKYGCYPDGLPLNIYFSHGITMSNKPGLNEIENNAPFMLYFTPRLRDEYRKISTKPCFCIVSPNVFYRRQNKVSQAGNAKGTIAFLAHTTPLIEDKMNFEEYCQQLRGLPDMYQPVTICLHYHDVNKGIHKVFYEQGFDVETVGHPFHKDFIRRFYNILRRFRFTTSNEVGSYTFYSVEMGIPFFLYGNEPDLYNKGDKNIELGKYDSYKRTAQYQKVRDLFGRPVEKVSQEQRIFVEEELGVYQSISRLKFAYILYSAYLIHIMSKTQRIISRLFNTI